MIDEQLRLALHNALLAVIGPSAHDVGFSIDAPKNPLHGDYATNAAMVAAKAAQMPPRALAERLTAELLKNSALIEKVEVAGPGFINITVQNAALQQALVEVLKEGAAFGRAKAKKNKKVIVEFVSANPTGPLHLGHARGAFMGDAISSLLTAAGFDVTREFYINDTGNQVNTLGRSVYARYRELFGEVVQPEKGEYPGAYVIDIAQKLKDQDGDRWLNRPESEWLSRCIEIGVAENLRDIKATLDKAGVHMDSWYSEKSLHDRKLPQQLLAQYRALGMAYEADAAEGAEDKVRRDESKAAQYAHLQQGGTFLRTSQFGDEEDRILVRKNGDPVYLLADLAYHQDKYARGYDWLIDVFGADHGGHLVRLRAGMSAAGQDASKLDFFLVQMMRLLKGGVEVKFSKRAGEIYLLSDLLDEVSPDVARFVFLMRSATTQFDFDLDLALKQSNDNPVFYVQYGHARMATLLRRAQAEGKGLNTAGLTLATLARLTLPLERDMLIKMLAFPQLLEQAALKLEPHRVLYYCQELIAQFHAYFTKYRHTERVISDDLELTQARLALVLALKQTLHNALALLGISAPDTMFADDLDHETSDA